MLHHDGRNPAGDVVEAADVHGEDPVPLFAGDVKKSGWGCDAGVVYQCPDWRHRSVEGCQRSSTDASSVTSQPMPTVCTPCRSATSSAASLALGSSRSRMATFHPAAASACAVARPMPRFEPFGNDGGLVGYGHGFLQGFFGRAVGVNRWSSL